MKSKKMKKMMKVEKNNILNKSEINKIKGGDDRGVKVTLEQNPGGACHH